MKIYFCESIRGGRDDARLYEHIVKTLGKFGKVLTEHVGDSDLCHTVVVAEVTQPSLGVGYELGHAYLKKNTFVSLPTIITMQ
ncbi:5-hydroxymethyl-dUMP N-hydrolase isoform 2-T2 [Syngnathus typhle]